MAARDDIDLSQRQQVIFGIHVALSEVSCEICLWAIRQER